VDNPYRELFEAPEARAFVLAGLLARLALPMTGIGIITMLAQLRDSYSLAGAVSATVVLTYALLSPQVSRMVDRYGQRSVLPYATVICVIGMLCLLAASWWAAPDWTLFLSAVLVGCMPSMSAMVRARWTALYKGQPRLQTAYALETVLDEVSFIVGPPLSVGLAVAAFPQAGVLAAALLLLAGMYALIAQRNTEPPIDANANTTRATKSVMRCPKMQLLAVMVGAMGVIVGTVDVVSVAFAAALGQPVMASLVLSAYAAGSCAAGLLFGAHRPQVSLHRLLLWGGVATAASTIPLLWVNHIAALACVVLVAGMCFAPTLIVAMSLVEKLVPAQRLTEGMTWLLASLNAGVALGAASSGHLVDGNGTQAGFSVALAAGLVVATAALWACRSLPAHSPAITAV
jgi:MFS family permease